MINPRFAPVTCVLLALALIPTIIHGYRGLKVEDGLEVSAIPEELAGMRSRPTGRKANWAEETLGAHDFIERRYRAGSEEIELFVGRSFDAKRLYHHPELAILRGTGTAPAGLSTLPGRPDVPVHLLTTSRQGQRGIAVYALSYENAYVKDPILFQLRIAGPLLFSGRRAMTLFLASDLSGSIQRLGEAPSTKLLAAAIEAFEQQERAGRD